MQPDTDVCFDVASLRPKSGFEVEPRTLDIVPLRNALNISLAMTWRLMGSCTL